MTFVRLAGCNAVDAGLACVRWCDTPESWDPTGGEERSARELADSVSLARVCITGGEPLLQSEGLQALVLLLHERGVRVHLETNGSFSPPGGIAFDWVTVSPKPPDYRVDPAFGERVDEIKVVADRDFSAPTLDRLAAEFPGCVLCLQPEASGGRQAIEGAIRLVFAHPEWRLSLQVHKILGIE